MTQEMNNENQNEDQDQQERIRERIRLKELYDNARNKLYIAYQWGRRIIARIIEFLQNHKELSQMLALGALVGFILYQLPAPFGGFLAMLCLVICAVVGLLAELRAKIAQIFQIPLEI